MPDQKYNDRMRAMYEWALANEKDESDKPDLGDSYEPAPERLVEIIRAAGGDPLRVVAWNVCGGEIVYRFVVSGETAASAWRSIREHAQEGGFWPVILGPNDAINAHNNLLDVRHAADESLKRAETLDLDSWRQSRLEERREYVPDFQRPHAQSWPSIDDVAVQTEFTVPLATISHRPLKQIWIGLVPVRHSWEVPSFFRFGNWNEVPGPDVHVALHRRWHAEFGAELVSFKNDILEFQVARPPMTRDAALELAQWQYDYCPDIVEQGTQSIEALAISLLNGPIWYFWWD